MLKFDRPQQIRRFFCPECDRRLWRLHSSRHYQSARETIDLVTVESNSSKTLGIATTNENLADDTWLEAFICSKHGRLWLLVRQESR